MTKSFYITTAIPYVNAAPHIGHALEFVQADVIARFQRETKQQKTVFLSGGDENALKNVQAAEKAGCDIQTFINDHAKLFKLLATNLSVSFDIFQKGSDKKTHYISSQKLWNLCKHDIYKKSYTGLYCIGCEAFYTPEELSEKGECFEHPGKKLESITEENYFFSLSKYQKQITHLIENNTIRIVPDFRKNEILSFLKNILLDISISRTNVRAKNWGVPVPDDDSQRMYVWFDALNIYQSGVGFGWNETLYNTTWPADIHVIGKGIARFHAVYWPAFLLSAGLSLPKAIYIHGYFTVNGQKMSKTLGNVVDPNTLIKRYGTDALRYYLLREIPATSDGDFSERRFIELYNADLANGLGNVAARIAKLASSCNLEIDYTESKAAKSFFATIEQAIDRFELHNALEVIWTALRLLDKKIAEEKPWTLSADALKAILNTYICGTDTFVGLLDIASILEPFLPETANKIRNHFSEKPITPMTPMFPRIAQVETR